jgi:uncharacterized protein YjiK
MTTHSCRSLRPLALRFVLLVLFLLTTATTLRAAVALDTHFPKVAGLESGDYLGTATTDQGAGSGITWWPALNRYLILDNNGRRILDVDRGTPPVTTSTLRRTITLSGFVDAEDIHWISGDTFVIAQELNSGSIDELVVLTIPQGVANITVDINDTTDPSPKVLRRLQFNNLGTPLNNKGIEAVALVDNYFYFTTESPPSASTWNVFKTENTGSGTILNPARTVAFSISALDESPIKALDISGMATDGTNLWLLSHEGTFIGSGPGKGRVLKMKITGEEIADYTLPALPSPHIWNQAEGIELFNDPADGLTKILLTGEVGDTPPNAGVDFMTLT